MKNNFSTPVKTNLPPKNILFETMFEEAQVGIVITDTNPIIEYINPEFTQIFGYTREEAIGKSVADLIIRDLENSESGTSSPEMIADGKSVEYETVRYHKSGRKIYVLCRLSPIVINNLIVGGFTFYTDISRRKEAQEALINTNRELETRVDQRTKELKQSEERYRTTIENSYDGVAIIQDRVHTYVNSSYARIYGYTSPEELMGRPDIDLIHPDDVERLKKRGQMRLKGEIPECERYEHKGIKKDGETIFVEVSVARVMNDSNLATLIFARDITRRKEIERKLEDAIRSSELANKSKSEFLANMSHEIRTPLNGVMGILNLLISTNLDNEQLDLIETGIHSSESLLTVINDILDFSKIEAGELKLENINFNLRNTIAEVVELPGLMARNKGLEFVYEIHHDIPNLLSGDPGRLRQIILNLTNNAIKFTDEGEIALNIFMLGETDDHVTLKFEVKDTGIGIPDDKRKVIFESFKQSDSSTTRKYGGTGLGLSISKKLAKMMHGEIGVKNSDGKGSTFWFTALLEKQIKENKEIPVSYHDIREKRFLLVADNRKNLDILKAYLGSWDCYCDTVEAEDMPVNFIGALEKAKTPYDSVIFDIHMTNMDLAEFGEKIRGESRLKDIPLIMITTQGFRGDSSYMEKIGFSAYLSKPVSKSLLFDCLINVLSSDNKSEKNNKSQIVTRHSISDARRSRTRILIAEDNPVNQKIALKLIEKAGYTASVVCNGVEALKALENDHYDIVLMDIQMPEMDGLEATKLIRKPESKVLNHEIPVIAMTAHAMQGDRESCLAAGMDDYTPKPIQPHDLYTKLEKYMR